MNTEFGYPEYDEVRCIGSQESFIENKGNKQPNDGVYHEVAFRSGLNAMNGDAKLVMLLGEHTQRHR